MKNNYYNLFIIQFTKFEIGVMNFLFAFSLFMISSKKRFITNLMKAEDKLIEKVIENSGDLSIHIPDEFLSGSASVSSGSSVLSEELPFSAFSAITPEALAVSAAVSVATVLTFVLLGCIFFRRMTDEEYIAHLKSELKRLDPTFVDSSDNISID